MVNFLLQRHENITPAEPGLNQFITTKNRFGSYEDFLTVFLQQGYQFCKFPDLRQTHQQLVLRHDIDFDTNFALQSALIEKQLGISSTYFFLMRTNFYNILSPQDMDNVKLIQEMGHTVSIHFDPTIYENFDQGLKMEVALFRDVFQTEVEIISLHRPNVFFQEYDKPIQGVEHTYQSKYFRDIKYISDSTGVWRFGHPFNSNEFAQQKSIHLLIHPIWWMLDGITNLDKLKQYYGQRISALKEDFSNNCIPFQKINESL